MQLVEGRRQEQEIFPLVGILEKKGKKDILNYGIDKGWERPTLNNMEFDVIGEDWAQWREWKFEEEEVSQAVFNLAGDKALGPDGFLMAFFLAPIPLESFLSIIPGDDEK